MQPRIFSPDLCGYCCPVYLCGSLPCYKCIRANSANTNLKTEIFEISYVQIDMPGPTATDLIFTEQANHNFSKTLGELKRHTLSIHNRLRSVLEDAAFVQQVSNSYGRPLVANERCGSWYIEPKRKDGSAYFKSTDGHTGAWSFSTRRLNIHLLESIGKHDGCIIVDSTRRGKRWLLITPY